MKCRKEFYVKRFHLNGDHIKKIFLSCFVKKTLVLRPLKDFEGLGRMPIAENVKDATYYRRLRVAGWRDALDSPQGMKIREFYVTG